MQGEAFQPQTFFLISFDSYKESEEQKERNRKKAEDMIDFFRGKKDREELESAWPGIVKDKSSRLF